MVPPNTSRNYSFQIEVACGQTSVNKISNDVGFLVCLPHEPGSGHLQTLMPNSIKQILPFFPVCTRFVFLLILLEVAFTCMGGSKRTDVGAKIPKVMYYAIHTIGKVTGIVLHD